VWSEKVTQDCDMFRIFECPSYYLVKEDKLDLRAKKAMVLGFQKRVEIL